MIVETGRDAEVVSWLASRGYKFSPPLVTLAVMDSGELMGAFVYNGYEHPTIELSVVSGGIKPYPRRIFRAAFDYPFNQLGCTRITARTRAGNKKVRRMIRRLGFRPEGKLRGHYGNDDAMIYGLLRHECRWL